MMRSWRFFAALAALLTLVAASPARAETSLLNVSYDVSRELYKELNPSSPRPGRRARGGGDDPPVAWRSSQQAFAVAAGLEADVVTMNQASDLELLAERGFVAPDWRTRFFPIRRHLIPAPWSSSCVRAIPRPSAIGTISCARGAGDRAQSQGDGQRPLYLSRGLGLRPEDGLGRGARDFVTQALSQRAGARRRRARGDHHLHPARRGRCARHLSERGSPDRAGAGAASWSSRSSIRPSPSRRRRRWRWWSRWWPNAHGGGGARLFAVSLQRTGAGGDGQHYFRPRTPRCASVTRRVSPRCAPSTTVNRSW